MLLAQLIGMRRRRCSRLSLGPNGKRKAGAKLEGMKKTRKMRLKGTKMIKRTRTGHEKTANGPGRCTVYGAALRAHLENKRTARVYFSSQY